VVLSRLTGGIEVSAAWRQLSLYLYCRRQWGATADNRNPLADNILRFIHSAVGLLCSRSVSTTIFSTISGM
jgi:hypothetical protein